jgi:hypothetical protein
LEKLELLRTLLQFLPARLEALAPAKLDLKPSPSAWSPKEELGHLLDSAANNHQRIVRTQIEDSPRMPDYDGDRWVELHAYHKRSWHELIDTWRSLNRQLLAAADAVPDSAWSRTCTIADSEPLTLKFVFEDYVDHMIHHVEHMGIDVTEWSSPATELKQAGD